MNRMHKLAGVAEVTEVGAGGGGDILQIPATNAAVGRELDFPKKGKNAFRESEASVIHAVDADN